MKDDLVEQLRGARQWCCIFMHKGQARHGNSDAPVRAAARIEKLERLLSEAMDDASLEPGSWFHEAQAALSTRENPHG